MLRVALLLGLAGLIGGCTPVTADQPLFAADPIQPAEGLWVWAESDCRLPASPDVKTWPQCAQPLRVEGGVVVVTQTPARPTAGLQASAPFAASDGDPLIIRLGGPEDGGGGRPLYHFVGLSGLQRDAGGRVIAAEGAILYCPLEAVPGLSLKENGECTARSVAGLRALAREQLRARSEVARLRWIAPLS